MTNTLRLVAIFLLTLGLVNCSSTPTQEEEQPEVIEETTPEEDTTDVSTDSQEQVDQVDAVDEDQQVVDIATLFSGANLVYYFDFDRSNLKPRSTELLDSQSPILVETMNVDPTYTISIEGHADERGSREYNQALGMRRAQAVSRYLRARGVPANNINTTSWGEDRPVAQGQNEEAWALNRRAEIVLPN